MTGIIVRVLGIAAGAAVAAISTTAQADGIREEPLARFEEPICPGVAGLQLDYASAAVSRIRENAQRFGLRIADEETCDPNMVLVIMEDGQSYLQGLAEERPHLFESLSRAELRDLLNATGPVRTWVSTEMRTRDGLRVALRENLEDIPQVRVMAAHSRIYVPVRRDITASMVLINRDAVSGLSIDQLADYATLRGLSETVPEAASETSTIQRLFDDDGIAAEGLTEFDATYLARLYDWIPNLPASARVQGIQGLAQRED